MDQPGERKFREAEAEAADRSGENAVTDLSGYELSLLRGGALPLRRGRRDGSSPILVVELQERTAPAESVKRLEHEYGLRAELDGAWAATPVALTRDHDRLSLVLKDPGGEPLDALLGRAWNPSEFLRIAIPLASALRGVHDRGLVHKDVSPANILVDVASGGAWLTAFGIAARARRHRPDPDPPRAIAGTLAYMAPEQTGRMNRSTDSRSDLYGLGVTFYQLLTGVLPFNASDAMELIHCHIAQQPVAPEDRAPGIPAQLSAIVLKLLAKTPEDRYQTAAGLEADLRRCLSLYVSLGRINPFPLGARDVPDRLIIPERLYGRDGEIGTLRATFDRVATQCATGVVFVSGDSGAGKSSVVNELHKALISQQHGLFASGKFDQYMRDSPYATLAQAFEDLVRALLGQSEAELRPWRDELQEALGPNGQLIVNLVPELELVVGKQQPVPDLAPQDAQRRFQMVFRRFLGVFARAERPLALFLDDLQWVDAATLELVEHLATHPEVRGLLLIGAYRSGEVGPSHPLKRSIEAIRKSDPDLVEVVLAPLPTAQLGRLVADALHCKSRRAKPLAQLLHEKTAGNPFFAVQFLASLVDEELLIFDTTALSWRWDIERIRAKSYSDNVVELMAGKLGRLSDAARDALKQLACLGSTADIGVLTLVYGREAEVTGAALDEAANAGLIVCYQGVCSFLHDRIQQAAYSLIPERRRAEFHLRIGRVLLAALTPDALGDALFDVVSQLNRGAGELVDRDERFQLAGLNLQAGRKAKASSAYAIAAAYLAAGARMLGPDGWNGRYDLLFQLQLERAECAFLGSSFDEAEQLIEELIEHAASKPDLAAAYSLSVVLHVAKSEYSLAAASALTGLNSFGIVIPLHPTWDQVQAEYEDVWRNLEGRPIESLLDLPLMTDPELKVATHLLSAIFDASYFSDFNLFCFHLCRLVNLGLRHGSSGALASACAFLAFSLGPVFQRYGDGYRFAKVACDLVEKHGFASDRGKVRQAMGIVALWTQPIETALDFTRSACQATTEAGDFNVACYSYSQIIVGRLLRNDPLADVWRESELGLEFVRAAGFQDAADIILSQQRFIANMRGRTTTFSTFDGPRFDEHAYEAQLTADRMPTMVCWYWILKLKARFLSGDYGDALAAAKKARALLWSSTGQVPCLDYYLYAALAAAALYEDASDDQRTEWRDLLQAHGAQLSAWAENYPPTFADKHALVAAEMARLEGRDADAMALYEQAIRSSRDHAFVQSEGLARELAARFYARRGFETIAQAYLRGAHRCYLRWGAEGKARQLEDLNPHLRAALIDSPTGGSIGAPIERLDVETMVKASQTLSSEIRLPELISQLVRLALEHAGAERGLLILRRDGELKIQAVATTGHDGVEVAVRERDVTATDLPLSVLRYVVRTRERVVLGDALAATLYADDEYVRRQGGRSVLCLPIVNQANLVGVLYLENKLTAHAFTSDRVAVLEMLASQAAISLENARLYLDLQRENHDRRRAEEELRRSEAHLHDAQTLGRMGSFVLDPSSELMQPSPELLRILGRDSEGENRTLDILRECIHPDDRQTIEELRARAIEEKAPWRFGYRILLPNSAIKFVESVADPVIGENGEIVEYVGTVIDVTEYRLAEQELRLSQALLSEAQRLGRTGSYFLSNPGAKLTWTAEMYRIYEYDQSEEPTRDKVVARMHPDDQDRMRLGINAALGARPDGYNLEPAEYRLLMPDGRIKFISSVRAPAGPEFSGVAAVIGATMDVTDRKNAEEALLRAQADLAHASRVNTMGELTAALAHEVNQPITAAVTNANAALRFMSGDNPDLEEAREAVTAIVHAGARVAEIISRTRTFFRKGVPQRILVDVDDVIRGTVVLLESEARRYSVSIRTWPAAGSPSVMGDRVQLQQVLVNLIMNGIDAMKGVDGVRELAIRTGRTDQGEVVVSISDTGIGLPSQDADQIFNTFFTTKPEGTGMGLSISRSIVEAHGGRLWAAPQAPRGTILQFTLPVVGQPEA